ncbi:RNA polymerase, sigma subunit, ECF family [Neorhodopirellula lusitana]|uniref:RNA polymerase, sigma subunit, ECF family n=1 Tax=Neorhodopirellula lusitana TaxID=445327 RepID=A0ABY1QKH7_9BACT|nr:sigma-70 family RNA polymerase sigma factor [Neorhodopirellula lusitana]SMP73320.1 RNA polymerase, sigma subunit, ECF family [Neorhodopirellula lusitana]
MNERPEAFDSQPTESQVDQSQTNQSSDHLSDSSNSAESLSRTERLIDAARAGDGEALGELLLSYRKYVVFLARTQLHHHMQAKADPSDVAQEVFLAAHGNIAEFRGDSAEEFAGWLRGILSNTLAMHVRKFLGTQKRDPRLEQRLNQSLASATGFLQSQLAGDVTSPSQHFARNEAFLELAGALEGLPDDYRQVIVLRHVDGLPFAEVARLMNRSVDSVEKLWVRGLAKLKQHMA